MNKKLFYVALGISILSIIVNLVVFSKLPDEVPIHWGFNGEADRWGSKYNQLLLGSLPLLILLLLQFLPKIDPRKDSFQKHKKAFSVTNFVIVVFLATAQFISLLAVLGYDVNFKIIVPILVAILFIVLGNYMTQVRPNYFMGIRTPWTLASDQVWRKTHRFGGIVFIILGLLSLTMMFDMIGTKIFICAIIFGAVLIYVYSYFLYKKLM